jgi:hypothetical protein
MSLDRVAQKQNSDGGWPYRQGASWTEPTAYAVLALLAAGDTARAERGIGWLRRMRRSDGGWPACAGVDESCWTTALVALVPPDRLGPEVHSGAVRWLLGITGEESSWVYRLRAYLSGSAPPRDQSSPGWPWVPRAAAWVGPTSLALLALELEEVRSGGSTQELNQRLAEGRRFLLNRMCRAGGWNHGSVNALGYPADAYPETTGMALAALRGSNASPVEKSLVVARRFLASCRSADALNWLRLGLSAHGALPAGYAPPAEIRFRTVPEMAMGALISAGGPGRNPFQVA